MFCVIIRGCSTLHLPHNFLFFRKKRKKRPPPKLGEEKSTTKEISMYASLNEGLIFFSFFGPHLKDWEEKKKTCSFADI